MLHKCKSEGLKLEEKRGETKALKEFNKIACLRNSRTYGLGGISIKKASENQRLFYFVAGTGLEPT